MLYKDRRLSHRGPWAGEGERATAEIHVNLRTERQGAPPGTLGSCSPPCPGGGVGPSGTVWASPDRSPLRPVWGWPQALVSSEDICPRGAPPGKRGLRRDREARPSGPGDVGAITGAFAQRKLQVPKYFFSEVILPGTQRTSPWTMRLGGFGSHPLIHSLPSSIWGLPIGRAPS